MRVMESAELLIEEAWLGHVDAIPGNMFSIGAFGSLESIKQDGKRTAPLSLDGIKVRARFIGCVVVAIVQVVGPPAVLMSNLWAWDALEDRDTNAVYRWRRWNHHNALADWHVRPVKKILGILLLYIFACNGLFVVLQEKKTWFQIYSTFKYLKNHNPEFNSGGKAFLYAGAIVNCWAVLFSTTASYAIVGASTSFKDLLFDSLGLLFLYNLDDIGGMLGFVYEDDWDGVRLSWIYSEMVKKDWRPEDADRHDGEISDVYSEPDEVVAVDTEAAAGAAARGEAARRIDEDPDYAPCVKRCGRRSAKGFDTCCRACGRGEAPPHDEDCGKDIEEIMAQDEEFVGGPHAQWGPGGYIVNAIFNVTLCGVLMFTVFAPVMTIGTPFTIIAPDSDTL
ncbi:unnamed protein product [Prorocentrum cordatum]|nr:unnamed protein product [Polarella glacialis]